MSVLKKSMPLLTTTFVNKVGNIGLSLLPMLLVAEHFSVHESSLIMTLTKATKLAGLLAGGAIGDRFGVKPAILVSFFISGVGLLFLPLSKGLLIVLLFAVIAQLGQSMFPAPSRILLIKVLPPHEQQESLGWLRSANNLGQVFSYSVGAIFSAFGFPFLFLMDSITSFVALLFGARLLPAIPPEWKDHKANAADPVVEESDPGIRRKLARRSWGFFGLCAFISCGYSFLYELFMISAPAKLQMNLHTDGLRVFSVMMVINTILCALLGVPAARFFKRPSVALPLGVLLNLLGSCIVFSDFNGLAHIYLGAFLISMGEITFTSLIAFVLIRTTPKRKGQGSLYSGALVIQASGTILAGALAFPCVVVGAHPVLSFCVAALIPLTLIFLARPGLLQLEKTL